MKNKVFFAPIACPFCQQLFFLVKDYDRRVHYFINNFDSPLSYHLCHFYLQNQFLESRPLDFFLFEKDWLQFTTKYRWVQETREPANPNLFVYWEILHPDQSVQSLLIQDNGTAIAYPPGNQPLKIGQLVRKSRLEKTKKISELSLLKPEIWQHSPSESVSMRLIKLIFSCPDEGLLDFQLQKILAELRSRGLFPLSVLPRPIQPFSENTAELHVRELSFHSDENTLQWLSDRVFAKKVEVNVEQVSFDYSPSVFFLV